MALNSLLRFFGDLIGSLLALSGERGAAAAQDKAPHAGKAGNYCFHLPVPLVYPIPRTARMLFLIKFAAEACARKMGWYFQKQQK